MPRLVSRYKCQIVRTIVLAGLLLTVADAASAQDRIYWDGGNTIQNGTVDGGDGTWDEVSTNWTNQTGTANYGAYGLGALPDRRFTGTGGTVNVTAAAAQAGRMQFSSSGYRLEGAAVDVQGRLVLSTGTTTTIANALTADGLESASTGALIIDATGTLQIDMGESVAAMAGNITNNGTLVFNRSDDLTLSNPINGSGLIRQQGAGMLTLNRAGATYSGNVEVINSTFRPNNVEILGVVALDGGTLRNLQPTDPPAEIALRAGGGTIFVDVPTFGTGNNISGIGKLTKTGGGQLRLKGDRTFSGGMDINEGSVVFRDSGSAVTSPFGSGLLTVAAGARLDLADTMTVPNAVSLVDTSDLRISTVFPITLSGNINFGGGSESLRLLGGTTSEQTVNFSGILSNGGFIVDATAVSSARTLEFSGAAANTYTGLTRLQTVAGAGLRFRLNKSDNVMAVPGNLTVDTGTQVVVAAHEQIVDTATVELGTGAVITLGDGSAVTETINVLSGAGAMGLTSLSEVRVASGTFSGVISGDGSLVKQSSGTLTLSGDSTYTGSTTTAAGQLRVSGSLAGGVAVASGATLSGTGTVGAVQVASGGIVAPGASAGTLSASDLELGATSVLNFELAAPGTVGGNVNDLIQVTGDLVLDGLLNVSDLGGLAVGTYTLFTYSGSLTDNGLSINTVPAGFVYSIDATQANAVNLVVAAVDSKIALSVSVLNFGTRSIHAAATTRTLSITNDGNVPVNIGALALGGDHAADFTVVTDACSNSALAVDGDCSISVSVDASVSGLRSAQLNIPSDAGDNPHAAALTVRMIGDPVLGGLDGSSQTFRIGNGPLQLDPNAAARLEMPGAVNLDGGRLKVEMISAANAAEDVLSFLTSGAVSLSATTVGSDVLVNSVVIGTLDNAIGAGEVLSVTFSDAATVIRVQTLMQAITYRNLNSADPVNGVREARITLSYLGQDIAATVAIDVQPQPPAPPPPPTPAPPTVVTGNVTTDTAGEPGQPVTISSATVSGDVSLAHVIIGSGVTLESGIMLGAGVIFQAPGLIQAIGDIAVFTIDGATIEQLANGQLRITAEGYRALILPVEIVQAQGAQTAGIYFGNNGDVLLFTETGLGIRAYALHVDTELLQNLLSTLALQPTYTSTGKLVVTPFEEQTETSDQVNVARVQALQREEIYFSARADVTAISADQSGTPGITAYTVPGLGTAQQQTSVFTGEDGTLMQQDLMPTPADWSALQGALLGLGGVTAVSIDTRGVIQVSIDGVVLRGAMDYTVVRAAADGNADALVLDTVGDLTGNGVDDYRVTYANGDKQYLFVYEQE
ncbi:MAG: choice-of-anchor D domain-containing protein [Pseudohongiella sp.]|uniref:choice-of-anchor D domain-containing protein n=1 Tax=Pseudohongiella sp. TaxID=1979412 RepID=UPI0034A00765